MFLSAAATVRYDDNIFFQKNGKQSDTVFVLMPGVDLHTSGGTSNAGIAFNEQFIRYSSHSSLNSDLMNVVGNASYDRGQSQLTSTASYQEMDQSNTNLRSRDQTVRRNLTDASIKWNLALAGKTSLGTGLQFDRTGYPKVGYVDNDVWSVPVDVYYAVTAKTDLSLGYSYRRSTTSDDKNNSKDQFFNVGARGQFTPKLSGQIRTGVTQRHQDAGGNDRLLGLSSNLTYAFTPKSSFSLQASNDYNNSSQGTSQRVLSLGLNGDFLLVPQWSVVAGVSYEKTSYMETLSRKDHFWVGNVGLSYLINSNASLQLSYVFRKNTSNANVEFQGSVVSLSASFRF